jgi:hypothetical protein
MCGAYVSLTFCGLWDYVLFLFVICDVLSIGSCPLAYDDEINVVAVCN